MQNIEDLYELSPMQQGMLFHTLYAPESEVYFEQLLCILEGELNIAAFQKAWEQVVARHAVLRSSFYWEEVEKPLQMVSKQVDLPWEKLDWRNLTADEQQKHLEDYLSSDRQKGFDLSLAPLMRFAIIQLTDQTYQFIWSHHHILFDGWSMQIVLKEVLDFYEANQRGEYLRLPPVRPYREYIEWLQQQDIEQAKKFWQQTLQGFEVPTLLAGSKEVGIYHKQHFQLSQTVTEKLQSAARQNQLTLNNLVQATWALLLSRYSQESDVVFGATVSGRPPEIAGAANSRLYKTGDLARYLPSGDIEYLGRIDNQVKIRGFRIELGEIETILNEHPEILQAVVIAREDEPGKKILVAYLVAQDNSLTSSSLRNLLKQKLPDYMIPAAFVFLEKLLAELWMKLLKYAGDKVISRQDNFFKLGGHSLLATQLCYRIRDTFKIELPLHQVFKTPTLSELANYIDICIEVNGVTEVIQI